MSHTTFEMNDGVASSGVGRPVGWIVLLLFLLNVLVVFGLKISSFL